MSHFLEQIDEALAVQIIDAFLHGPTPRKQDVGREGEAEALGRAINKPVLFAGKTSANPSQSTLAIPANPQRIKFFIQNNGTVNLAVSTTGGDAFAGIGDSVELKPGQALEDEGENVTKLRLSVASTLASQPFYAEETSKL